MTKAEAAEQALADMADELGTLEQELKPFKAKAARVETLRRALRAPYASADPTQSFEVLGARYKVIVGPAGNQSHIDMAKLTTLVQTSKLLPYARVTVADIEEQFGADILAAVTSTSQSGTRGLQVLFMPAAAKRKAG